MISGASQISLEAATCDVSLGGAVETLKEPGAHFISERLHI